MPPSICLQYPLYAILTTKNLSDDTDTLIYLFTGKSGGNPLLHDKFISWLTRVGVYLVGGKYHISKVTDCPWFV